MRSDIQKIICERERAQDYRTAATLRQGRRGKSGRSKMDRRIFVSNIDGEWDEDRPLRAKQPMSMHSKDFTDFLTPLKGWVAKQVGRPFANAHSELRRLLKGGSTTQQHVLQHLNDYLIPPDRVRIIDGVAYEAGTMVTALTPIDRGTVYADPRDGILKWGTGTGRGFLKDYNPRAQQECYRKLPRKDGGEIKLGPAGKIFRKGGKWYHHFTRTVRVDPSDPRPAIRTLRISLGTLYKEVEEEVEVLASRGLLKRFGFRPEKKRRGRK